MAAGDARRARRSTLASATVAGLMVIAIALTGCTGGAPGPSSSAAPAESTAGSVALTSSLGVTSSPGATSVSSASGAGAGSSSGVPAVSPVPVTPEGMATGPGVTDTSITLGLLIDRSLDRGFRQGFELWRTTINRAGGECGRIVQVIASGSNGVPTALPEAYLDTARDVLGYVTLADTGDAAALAEYAGGDGVPAVTTMGVSEQLAHPGPVVIGPTNDIMAINAFAYLQNAHQVGGGPVGVMSDGSTAADDSLNGLRWAAEQAKVTLDVREAGVAPSSWGAATAVFSFASPADTVSLLTSVPSTVTVMTTLDGYDPGLIAANPAAAAAVADKRLLVVTATPALGSDHPAAAAVAAAFTAAGGTDPGPRLLEGYAAGAMWGRLLDAACTAADLTRSGVADSMTTIGAAPIDSVLGPTDPGLVVNGHQPATRLSAIAAVDLSAPTGLAPLTWLEAAPNVGDYKPNP